MRRAITRRFRWTNSATSCGDGVVEHLHLDFVQAGDEAIHLRGVVVHDLVEDQVEQVIRPPAGLLGVPVEELLDRPDGRQGRVVVGDEHLVGDHGAELDHAPGRVGLRAAPGRLAARSGLATTNK